MGERAGERTVGVLAGELAGVSANVRSGGWMSELADGRADGQAGGQMCRRADGRADVLARSSVKYCRKMFLLCLETNN